MTFQGTSYKNDEFRRVIWRYHARQNRDYSKNTKTIQNANIGNLNFEVSLWCLHANEMIVFPNFENVKSDPPLRPTKTEAGGCEGRGSTGGMKGGQGNKVEDEI